MGRKSKATVRKKEILEHFFVVLKEEGFENASIAKIAQRMDVNPSLLIHYFKTKDEMTVSLVDFILSKYEETFLEGLQQLENAEERFLAIVDIMFGEEWLGVSDESVFYACYYMSTRDERIKERFVLMYNKLLAYLLPEVKSWMEEGLICEADPRSVAEYLMVVNEGLTFFENLSNNLEAFRKRSLFIKEMIMKGLQAKVLV